MPTQDFVSPKNIDEPRHDQNMPEGVETPVPKSWKIERPGYQRHNDKTSDDHLLGNAGPNVGYALTLVAYESENFVLADHEHRHDVEILLGEIAMRRAAFFGRAPILGDVRIASELLGYDQTPSGDLGQWRPRLANGCGHDEHRRRTIVNSLSDEIISAGSPSPEEVLAWHEKLKNLF